MSKINTMTELLDVFGAETVSAFPRAFAQSVGFVGSMTLICSDGSVMKEEDGTDYWDDVKDIIGLSFSGIVEGTAQTRDSGMILFPVTEEQLFHRIDRVEHLCTEARQVMTNLSWDWLDEHFDVSMMDGKVRYSGSHSEVEVGQEAASMISSLRERVVRHYDGVPHIEMRVPVEMPKLRAVGC